MESSLADGLTSPQKPPVASTPDLSGGAPPAQPFFANPFLAPFGAQQPPVGSQVQPQPGVNQFPINFHLLQQQLQAVAAASTAAGGMGDNATAMAGAMDPSSSIPGAGAAGDFRINPLTGGLFLAPSQYQEMMQQYLQTLMLQAGGFPGMKTSPEGTATTGTPTPGAQGPTTTTQSSPSPPLTANDPAAAAFAGLATLNLGQLNLASPTTPSSSSPLAAGQQHPASGQQTVSVPSRHSTPSKVSTASVGVASGASTNCSTSPSPSFGELPLAGATPGPELGRDEEEVKQESNNTSILTQNHLSSVNDGSQAHEASTDDTVTPKTSNATGGVGDNKAADDVGTTAAAEDEKNSQQPQKRKFNARADELFRKQMNEIEHEINRRIQNRNVRKMGHLIREPSPPPTKPSNPTLDQLRSSFLPPEPVMQPSSNVPSFAFGNVQMAQPPTENVASLLSTLTPSPLYPAQPQHVQLPSYALPATSAAPSQPQQSQNGTSSLPSVEDSLLDAIMPNPATITPEMAAMLLKKIQQDNPQLLSSLGLVPASATQKKPSSDDAEAFRLPAPPTTLPPPVNRRLPAGGVGVGVGPPQTDHDWRQLDKRHSLNSESLATGGRRNAGMSTTASTSATTGAENNKENNSQEPIWVMRDSYLKRLEREEQRSRELQQQQNGGGAANGEEGSSSAVPGGVPGDDEVEETDKLLDRDHNTEIEEQIKSNCKKPATAKKEVMVHEPAVLIEGVLFRARYLGSTQLTCDGRPTKSSRMAQAQEAVARVKAPDGEIQPSTEIDLFISTEKIMVLNTDLQRISETDVRQDILMDHALKSISYIADIGDVVVLMARRMPSSSSSTDEDDLEVRRTARVVCHVFESDEASFIAQSIGQAFQVAYVEFLRANGIDDPTYLREIDYQEVLNSQEMLGEELDLFSNKEMQKDVVVPKKLGEPLGIVVVESGWGSMLPTVVVAALEPNAPASRSNQVNIGDQIIAINGISLVGLPLAKAQQNIKNAKTSTAVRLTIVCTPPVVEVRIKRPDTKYQLGFSVQNGVICSLLRGGIAERGGIRVGHRIIEINHKSVVAVPHEKIVNMLATATGEIHMKTMPTSMFRLLTGQEVPNYI